MNQATGHCNSSSDVVGVQGREYGAVHDDCQVKESVAEMGALERSTITRENTIAKLHP